MSGQKTEDMTQSDEWPEELPGRDGQRRLQSDCGSNIWAFHPSSPENLISQDWRQPIIIRLDNECPESVHGLICFEINHSGLLLLQQLDADGVYERVGCAQKHKNFNFFDGCAKVDVTLV